MAAYVRAASKDSERANPPRGRSIEVDGVLLHYIEEGAGPPVVILHGNGAMAEEMSISGLIEALAEEHRVVAFDRPGYGHSTRPRDRSWTPGRQAELILRACDALHLDRPILVAHSWATLVAVAAALQKPSAVRGLVLIAGYYYPTARVDAALLALPAVPLIGTLLRHTLSPLIARLAWPKLIAHIFAPQEVPERFNRRFPKWMALRPGQLRASAEESGMMVPSAAALQDRYGEISVPVSILAGTDDRISDPSRQSARLAEDVPNATLQLLPGLGHMLHYFAAREVLSAVRELRHAGLTAAQRTAGIAA
jgi:pimeloyl-ACP methyl ester carboxylesterase